MAEGVLCRRIAIGPYRQCQVSGPQWKLLPAVQSGQITQKRTDCLLETKYRPPPKKRGNFSLRVIFPASAAKETRIVLF